MKPHPLTPRKPTTLASAIAWSVTLTAALLSLTVMMTISPPTAWLPAVDEPRVADLQFLGSILADEFRAAIGSPRLLTMITALASLPVSFVEDLVRFDIVASLAIRGSAALVAGAILGMSVFSLILSGTLARPEVQHVRGAMLLSGRAARSSLRAAWSKRYSSSASDICLAAALPMPDQLTAEHFLLVGGTGAGKTTVLQTVIGNAIARGDRILLVDPKGDLTARLPTEDFALISLDDERSVRMALDLDVEDRGDAAELLEELLPETSDPSWSNGARQVGRAVIERLQKRKHGQNLSWDWSTLEWIFTRPVEELHAIVAPHSPVAASIIDVTRDETRKQAMSFWLVLVANAVPLISACAQAGGRASKPLSIRRWVEGEGPQVLVLRQSQRYPKWSAGFIRIALKIATDAVVERAAHPNPSPIWFAVDELKQIGRTPSIPRLLEIGRSASARIIGAVQSPSQLRDLYGLEEAKTIFDNLGTKIVGRVVPGATAAEIAEQWIGKRTVAWSDSAGHHADGSPRLDRKVQEDVVVSVEHLTNELGLRRDVWGNRIIRALVLGHGNIAQLEWRVGLWPVRRRATVTKMKSNSQT